ncbi:MULTISPECIES: RNA polymerase sigma factor [Thalassospira]|jgi:RNA polymerase sigma-70 factor (ECF subfamily)|nr:MULTISPECIES: RNA polymerase sigma factor [Thalassospira]MAL28845.1 RNA polymerase sigma factor [Thalassospira sp.]MBL4842916.1 RNA polymerase sigma factor [Thalassospira sp.]MDM7977953.1 RNA polymerase sigma factor [Thalassospira xiamenensis]QPL34616.1 RNA polymerase sigma factor [Thalassospira sp. B30-1]HBN50504.1 RNA polymerase sigma factor [Thalassospira sp.]
MNFFAPHHITANLVRAFEKERASLLRLAMRKLGNPDEAKDIVQDAFVRIAGAKDRQEPISDPPAFLRTVVLNLIRDHQRRRNAGHIVELKSGLDPLEWTAEDRPLADNVIYHRQRLQAFEQALSSLPTRSREVFILRKLHGKTHDEIAAATGLSKAAIEKHLYRAMTTCRDLMKHYD